MTVLVVGLLVGLAAVSLGLRTTAILIPRVHPIIRLIVACVIGTIFATVTLQVCERYRVYDLGLGLLVSLSPVGVFDLIKWWFRWRPHDAVPHD